MGLARARARENTTCLLLGRFVEGPVFGMIAVLADDAEHSVVSEFFELFKTPWEFYRSDSQCDVLICANHQFFRSSSAKLVLVYGSEQQAFDQEKKIEVLARRSGRVLSYKGDRIPVYGDCLTFKSKEGRTLVDEQTREPAILEIASEGQMLVRLGFDLFHEIRYLFTRGQPLAHARIPALELHIAVLRDLILSCSVPLVEIPPIPAGYSFITCLTHDVDHVGIRNHRLDRTMFGFLYRAIIGSLVNFCTGRRSVRYLAANWMAAFSLPFVYLGIAKDFWNQLDRYLEIEKGLNSTFFVIPKRGDPGRNADGLAPSIRATRYDVAGIADQIQGLLSAHREIGLHGIDAWNDSDKGRAEFAAIRGITSRSDVGVRMHWLYFDEQSPAKLEEAGFSYDSTVGYNETVGYRAGTSQAYKPLEVKRILELPMHIMDTALFYPAYLNLSPGEARDVVKPLVENASRFGGVLTVNWHDRSIAPERLWGEFYVELLEEVKTREAWFPTAAQAVSWFRQRRSAIIETVTLEDKAVRVRISVNASADKLPGLRVRVHEAPAATHSSGQAEPGRRFSDITLNQSEEIEIAV